MYKKIRCILLLGICCILLGSTGCQNPKEVLLEHSGQDLEFVADDGSAQNESSGGDGQLLQKEDAPTIDSGNEKADQKIYVHVCGQVVHPGVYQVAADARVFEAIEAAGGLTPAAAKAAVNQAQMLSDGQMLYVPAEGEAIPDAGAVGTAAAGQTENGKVNLNTATLEELMTLQGIGEGKAQSILDYRQEHGSFQNIDELMNVAGIKEGTYSKLKDQITI